MLVHYKDFFKHHRLVVRGVIQVGAHYGEEYDGWKAEGITNFMFFEPVYRNYSKLKMLHPLETSYNMALGNTSGEIQMYTETSHGGKSCSILKPKKHLDLYPDIKFNGVETVRIDKLDNIDFDRHKYNALCIDVQGYELEVLRGAEQTLKYIDLIEIEVNKEELYEGCPMIEDIDDFLENHVRIYVYWSGEWGNAYYIKK